MSAHEHPTRPQRPPRPLAIPRPQRPEACECDEIQTGETPCWSCYQDGFRDVNPGGE